MTNEQVPHNMKQSDAILGTSSSSSFSTKRKSDFAFPSEGCTLKRSKTFRNLSILATSRVHCKETVSKNRSCSDLHNPRTTKCSSLPNSVHSSVPNSHFTVNSNSLLHELFTDLEKLEISRKPSRPMDIAHVSFEEFQLLSPFNVMEQDWLIRASSF